MHTLFESYTDQLVNVNGALGLEWTENWTLIILSNAEFLNQNHLIMLLWRKFFTDGLEHMQ